MINRHEHLRMGQVSTPRFIDAEEYCFAYGARELTFERFHKGWVTWVSSPDPDTGQVCRVTESSSDDSFARNTVRRVDHFNWGGEWGPKGEVWCGSELVETTELPT